MTIAGVASALPQHKYDQRVLLQALQKHWGPKVDNPLFLERLQARVGVETRHLALPLEEYYGLTRWGDANNKWIEVAQDLGQKAMCCALATAVSRVKQAELSGAQIGRSSSSDITIAPSGFLNS